MVSSRPAARFRSTSAATLAQPRAVRACKYRMADCGACRPPLPLAAVAKAGVNKYTKMLAGQLLEHNINVNCIAPGATKSGRFVATVKDGTQGAAFQNEKFRERFLKQMEEEEDNIGRPGSVDEVARVVDFFAGPLGSFVSGEVLKVDGGVARL